MALELFKPLKILNGKPIVFNEFCHYIDPEHKSYRPFVIFYDDQEDCYYYLKARGARKSDGSLKTVYNIDSPSFNGEIYVEGTHIENSLFEKDSLVDCSQIFKIDADYLELIVDTNHITYRRTNKFCEEVIKNIIDGVVNCILQKPPYLSILEVSPDNNFLPESNSLYLCPKKFEESNEFYDRGLIFIKEGLKPQDFELTPEKFEYVESFCRKFLSMTCPDKIEEFNSLQTQSTAQGGQ